MIVKLECKVAQITADNFTKKGKILKNEARKWAILVFKTYDGDLIMSYNYESYEFGLIGGLENLKYSKLANLLIKLETPSQQIWSKGFEKW